MLSVECILQQNIWHVLSWKHFSNTFYFASLVSMYILLLVFTFVFLPINSFYLEGEDFHHFDITAENVPNTSSGYCLGYGDPTVSDHELFLKFIIKVLLVSYHLLQGLYLLCLTDVLYLLGNGVIWLPM